jgi:hypothetical protein
VLDVDPATGAVLEKRDEPLTLIIERWTVAWHWDRLDDPEWLTVRQRRVHAGDATTAPRTRAEVRWADHDVASAFEADGSSVHDAWFVATPVPRRGEIVYRKDPSTVARHDVLDGSDTVLLRSEAGRELRILRIDPTGTLVTVRVDDRVSVVSVASGGVVAGPFEPGEEASWVHPGGGRYVWLTDAEEESSALIDVRTGERSAIPEYLLRPALVRDGLLVATDFERESVWLFDARGGHLRRLYGPRGAE